MKLNVYNPTDFKRKQWVLFGSETALGNPVMTLPRSFLNVGLVDVPADFKGELDVLHPGTEPFEYHPMLIEDMTNGFNFYIAENGTPLAFGPLQAVWDHERVKAAKTSVKTKNGYFHLYIYCFHKLPVIHYELVYHCENLNNYVTNVSPLKFGWFGQAKEVLHKCFNGNENNLLFNQTIDDTQGRRWSGVFVFYNPAILQDPELRDTVLGIINYPLHGVANWSKWGALQAPLPKISPEYIQGLLSTQSNLNYFDPFGHFGLLGAKFSGQTGDQGGWGPWQNWWTVGANDASTMCYDQMATSQDHCRPNSYFEIDCTNVKSSEHPKWVTWDQRTHWSSGISSDRLRRNNQSGSLTTAWYGYDYQHDSATLMANDVILNGSIANQDYLKRKIEAYLAGLTLPSVFPGWSTNGFLWGRAGRAMLAGVYCYLATGDRSIIDRFAKKINEELLQTWQGKNGNPIKAGRIIGPTPQVGGFPNSYAWIPWEDAIWVYCLEAVTMVLKELGLTAEANKLDEVVWQIGRSVALYAWMPNRLQIATAIAWNGTGAPPTNYNDPNQFKPADGTDYKTWAIPCLHVTLKKAVAKNDQAVVTQCNKLLGQLVTPTFAVSKTTYLGAAQIKPVIFFQIINATCQNVDTTTLF